MSRTFWITTAGLAAGLATAATTTLLPLAPASADDAASAGTVVARTSLAERSGPSRHAPIGGAGYAKGSTIAIDCGMDGSTVDGNQVWYKVAGQRTWVSARYVEVVGDPVPACTAGSDPADPDARAIAGLNVRKAPSTSDQRWGSVARGGDVSLDCRVNGSTVAGPDGRRTSVWYAVTGGEGAHGGFVSAAWVRTDTDVAYCSQT